MGHKNVCLNCHTAFNMPFGVVGSIVCKQCGQPTIRLPHRFRPPKKSESAKWDTVKFLIENGFPYQHIVERNDPSNYLNRIEQYVQYPENLRDAQAFVIKYKSQAKKPTK
ncbi:hypothetical protein [Hymenobacter psychrotolerans]|uniref:hypothetical protein n=1 Tax=Hymenobacter psychrotolerans TaxID=344998 RepID=UPI001114F6E3|nr:hypothetical protein [Hymenobacter psychrotolerans]